MYYNILRCSTRLKYPNYSYYMFTEPLNILQDYQNHIVINLPNKDVTTDQVLSTLVPYVATTWIFIKIYDKKSINYPNMWRIKLYVSTSISIQTFFCPCYCKSQSFDKHQRTKIIYKLPSVNRLNYPTHFQRVLARNNHYCAQAEVY